MHDVDVKIAAHQLNEGIMFLARLSCPDDIFEQQISGICRGQSTHLKTRAMHDDLLEITDL